MQVVLFHSVLGLRPAVLEFAAKLREAGHTVTTPDLYAGETFGDYETGSKKWFEHGIPTLLKQADEVAKDIEGDVVFAGFSNGAALAEYLGATHAGACGVVLMHGALPLPVLELKEWPANVPVQLHYNEHDPFRDPANDVALRTAVEATGAHFEEYLYPGKTHLFADSGMPDYEEKSATLMTDRVLDFLTAIEQR